MPSVGEVTPCELMKDTAKPLSPPLELSVLVSLGLHEGALAAWLRLVLGDAEHTARLYEPGATLRLDSGRAAQVVALCVSLPAAIRPRPL